MKLICKNFFGMNIFMDFENNKYVNIPNFIVMFENSNQPAYFDINKNDFIENGDLNKLDEEAIKDWYEYHEDEVKNNIKNKEYNKMSDYVGEE